MGYVTYAWRQVWNTNASNENENVTWTLPAGTYTIQFTYKESGNRVDTVEILQVAP